MDTVYNKTTGWKILNSPRQKKKLLVLDLDLTLADFYGKNELLRKSRPHLHYFLEEVYYLYDIIIWSSSAMDNIELKLKKLGVLDNNSYKLLGYLGNSAMLKLMVKKSKVQFRTKPLSVIWKKFPQYNASNTIIIDDKKKNFICNRRNGLLIKKFFADSDESDDELFFLIDYLRNICRTCSDFSQWKRQLKYS